MCRQEKTRINQSAGMVVMPLVPDSWRGPPGLHGRGHGPEGRERQWGGRGPQPPTPAGPVDVPRAPPNKLPER